MYETPESRTLAVQSEHQSMFEVNGMTIYSDCLRLSMELGDHALSLGVQ
ncbi:MULTISPECIES: hypothetical protein [unclassified Pseudomonas]